jgi:hypothetical protein
LWWTGLFAELFNFHFSNDVDRMEEASEELHKLVADEALKNAGLLGFLACIRLIPIQFLQTNKIYRML